MLRLIQAEFKNFRLLRDLSLDFLGEDKKTLTIIRAENDTGKTTIMTALQWALYGDVALPDEGKDYRLHPINWKEEESVSISVQVDFEVTTWLRNRNGPSQNKRIYRIIRSTREKIKGTDWERSPSFVQLFHLDDAGSNPIDPPEARIKEMFLPELREVFFTDGDRALSFIEETSVGIKRKRVEKAIRSLLGLEVIEDALKHVKKAASEVNKSAKSMNMDTELTDIAKRIEDSEKEIEDLEKRIEDARDQVANFDDTIADTEKKIEAALTKGDREELKRDLAESKEQIKHINLQQKEAEKKHSQLFKSMPLVRDLLAPVLAKGLGELTKLHDAGKIPSTTIPILEERLEKGICICGESLSSDDISGKNRCKSIRDLIEKSKDADALQSALTDLYYASQSIQLGQTENGWPAEYEEIFILRDNLRERRDEAGKKQKALEAKLDQIPDTDIQGLRKIKNDYSQQRDRKYHQMAKDEQQLAMEKKQQSNLITQREKLLRKQDKGAQILAELHVTQDIEKILTNSYDRITNEELEQVSQLMNDIFLEMIGADPEQGAIIRRAEINKEFDIVVYSDEDRTLNPDSDLNGASRRALTLAFILALTKVSKVEAPNVIDTPLGMMSGYVKMEVLKTSIRESAQLILFLTRSEIAGCEEILDAEAARVITLTNPVHYPRMLNNKPQTNERSILKCACDHRKTCKLCERRMDAES